MSKQKGRTFLVKISDGAGGFTAFAGITSKTLDLGTERIDATTPDATTPEGEMWRDSLAGTKTLNVSGDFTLVEDVAESDLIDAAMTGDAEEDFQILIPGVGTFEGTFAIVGLQFGDDGKITGSMSLESIGKPTFTKAA